MNRKANLAKNTAIISLGTLLPKLTAFITLPILTACLTKTEYGTYDLINTLVSLILPIATLRIEQGAFRFLLDCREDKKLATEVVSTMVLFVIPIALVVMSIFYVVTPGIEPAIRFMICIYFTLDSVFQVVQQIIRGFSKNTLYSVSAIINAIVNMSLIVVIVKYQNLGLFGVLVSLSVALVFAIIILVIFGSILSYVSFRAFSVTRLKALLSYSWPMVPNSLSLWVMNLSDRLLITTFLGVEANAVYAVANKIPQLLNSMQGSFVYAWQENASIASKDQDVNEYYSTVFDDIYCLLAGLMAGLIIIMPILFRIFIRGDYQNAYYQMPVLLMAMFCSCVSSFLGGIYVAHKKTTSVGVTTIIAAIINFVVNILFVRKIGIWAGSISTLVSYAFLMLYRMKDVKKFQPIVYKKRKCLVVILILILMSILECANSVFVFVLNTCIGIPFALLINGKIVKTVCNQIIGRKLK